MHGLCKARGHGAREAQRDSLWVVVSHPVCGFADIAVTPVIPDSPVCLAQPRPKLGLAALRKLILFLDIRPGRACEAFDLSSPSCSTLAP